MAIYHLSLKNIQRSKGRSSTAASAYRSRVKITDERTGLIYDYSRKKGVEAKEIFTPDGSKISRSELWNLAEAAEKRKDGITAREYELALPSELDAQGRQNLARNFCDFLMKRYGVAVDLALHAPTPEGDQRNFHAHVLITTRRFSGGQLLEKTDFDLSGRDLREKGLKPQKEQLEEIRQEWEKLANHALEASGSQERISHKSHEERGIKAVPSIHMGVATTAMERKGIATDRGELNRRPVLRRLYGEFVQVKKEIRAIEAELAKMRQKREAENGYLRQDAKESTAKEAARSGFPAPAANVGSKRPAQPNKVTAGRPEEIKVQPGRTGESNRSLGKRPGIACGGVKSNSQGNGRIFGQESPRGLSGRSGCGPEDFGAGGSDRENMGGSGDAGRTHWLDQLEAIKSEVIERMIEYRTIGDLLAMKEGIELEPEEEESPGYAPEGPK